ncbi:MAG: sensor histidine kinase [Thermoanaerobaculia bacterium]
MISPWVIVSAAIGYLGLLFAVAFWGDRRSLAGRSLVANPWVYSLSLGVYCSAWTFYGSVGRAASGGIAFLPVYLGPTLAFSLAWILLRKIVRISKHERITSIADFLASRYGKSSRLGALVAGAAVIGVVPYIALQLKAISSTFLLLVRGSGRDLGTDLAFDRTSFVVAAVLAVFAILFGTRKLDVTERHEGMVTAIAFESVVKLVAFLAVGLWVTYGLHSGPQDLFRKAAARPDLAGLLTFQGPWDSWLWILGLSFLAVILLPRQFQIAVVENTNERHLRKASWQFPLYLLIINLFVLPIALAGRLQFPNPAIDADTYVLSLPLAFGQNSLALIVFLGGLSASTGMVIVESVALSTMISNELVFPLLLRSALGGPDPNLGARLLFVRRLSILLILGAGQFYLYSTHAEGSLVSLGLISFAAVAQFAPSLIAGLYWRGATHRGAFAGLIGGLAVWAYTLPVPAYVASGTSALASMLSDGPFGIGWLRPHELFGVSGLDPISHSLFWSLLLNCGLLLAVSSYRQQSAIEHAQARRFVDVFRRRSETTEVPLWSAATPVAAIRSLLERFLGAERTARALNRFSASRGFDLEKVVFADGNLIAYAERLLAGTTGAASARVALASVAQERELSVGELMLLVDETSKVIATSRALEEKSRALERTSLELRRANERLLELDRLKDDFLATMAHELRTPLTSIRAFAEILHDHPELELTKQRQFLEIVLHENERLTRLINQVLDLAKIESGEGLAGREEIALEEMVAEAVGSFAGVVELRKIELEVRCPAECPRVEVVRDRIVQVLVNLLSNALKYCRPAGWIAVDVAERAGVVEIAVADDGPGVPESERRSVFERFRQVGVLGAGDRHGIGLGLSICHEVVVGHGGRIWVESSERGGARFVFTLPALPATEHRVRPEAATAAESQA